MRVWLDNHEAVTVEPTIAEHEDFLLEQLVKNPSIGYKLMMKAILKGRGVAFKEAPIRAWLAAHKGALPMPTAAAASSSAAPSMALLQLSDMEEYAPFLRQQLVDSPAITATLLREKLIAVHAVSCLDRTMQTWLDRARAIAPKRAIKRAPRDLPTLENLEEQGDYLRGLLADDSSLGYRQLREAIKTKGFLVSDRTMRNWLERHHRECTRAIIAAPKEGLQCLDIAGLRHYEPQLLKICFSEPRITYDRLKERFEQECSMTCTKSTMQHWMRSPFTSKVVASRDELLYDHLYFLKTVYNDHRDISLMALRVQLAVRRDRTASNDDMTEYMSWLPRNGGRPPLRTKTSLRPMIVNDDDLSPYLDQLYVRIAEEPSVTSQSLRRILQRTIASCLILLR